jgi:hypothetical protein
VIVNGWSHLMSRQRCFQSKRINSLHHSVSIRANGKQAAEYNFLDKEIVETYGERSLIAQPVDLEDSWHDRSKSPPPTAR